MTVQGTGTKADPWQLTTPPGSGSYEMYRDEAADPPALVCQVGSTTLRYRLSAIDDLHAWLRARHTSPGAAAGFNALCDGLYALARR